MSHKRISDENAEVIADWLKEHGPAPTVAVHRDTDYNRRQSQRVFTDLYHAGEIVRAWEVPANHKPRRVYAYPDTVPEDSIREWEHVSDDSAESETESRTWL